MPGLEGIGKLLLVMGGVLVLLGLLFVLGRHIPFLGKLPGDILLRRDNVTIFFPIVTFLLLSLALTVIVNLVLWLWRR